MTELPTWLAKAQILWVAIGTFITVIATGAGIPLPGFLSELFSQGVVDAFVAAFGAVMAFVQVIRAIFAAQSSGRVTTASAEEIEGAKVKYLLNPFRLNVV